MEENGMKLTVNWRWPWKIGYFPNAIVDESFSVEAHRLIIGPIQIRWYRWIRNRYTN